MGRIVVAIGCLACLWHPAPRSLCAQVFTEVTLDAGLTYVQHDGVIGDPFAEMTGGAAAGDFDGDGWVDLYVTRLGTSDLLFRNLGNGTFAPGIASGPLNSNGAVWGDIDNDGDLDLYVTSIIDTQQYLYVNDGNGNVTEEAVIRGAALSSADTHFGQSPTLGDFDRDGYLDIYTTEWRTFVSNPSSTPTNNRLLRNQGSSAPGHFADVTVSAGVSVDVDFEGVPQAFGFSPRFADMDGDRWPDLVISSDFGTSKVFWNNQDGTFTNGTVAAIGISDELGMGSAVGDFNGDGRLDWYITSISDATNPAPPAIPRTGNALYQNLGNRQFTDAVDIAGVRDSGFGWGTTMFDFDNDGDLDLVATNGFYNDGAHFLSDPMQFWRNEGNETFTDVSSAVGVNDTGQGRGLLTFDYDHDGDLDLFVVNNGSGGILYRNDGGNNNDFLRIETEGTESNRDGIGALITVTPTLGGPSQIWEVNAGSNYLGQSEKTAHFGLGASAGPIDRVLIQWPSGITQLFTDVAPNSTLFAVEQVRGDISNDGIVDIGDFTLWGDAFGETGLGIPADVSGDGKVDIGDFTLWGDNFGITSAVSSTTFAVPEPTSFGLLAIGMAALIAISLRRRF